MQVSVSLFDWGFLLLNTTWLLSSLSHIMDSLLNLGNMVLASLLNRTMARLGNLGFISVDLICNKDICLSVLISWHFFIVIFTNLIHVSACPLL